MVCQLPDRWVEVMRLTAPDFYTVEEAADRLRIGRTSAYLAAKQYRATGGAEGLPVIAIRGSLRVPRRKLEEWAGGPLSDPGEPSVDDVVVAPVLEVISDPDATPTPKNPSTRAPATRPAPQLDLFDPPEAS